MLKDTCTISIDQFEIGHPAVFDYPFILNTGNHKIITNMAVSIVDNGFTSRLKTIRSKRAKIPWSLHRISNKILRSSCAIRNGMVGHPLAWHSRIVRNTASVLRVGVVKKYYQETNHLLQKHGQQTPKQKVQRSSTAKK